jgi:hypothetical protein
MHFKIVYWERELICPQLSRSLTAIEGNLDRLGYLPKPPFGTSLFGSSSATRPGPRCCAVVSTRSRAARNSRHSSRRNAIRTGDAKADFPIVFCRHWARHSRTMVHLWLLKETPVSPQILTRQSARRQLELRGPYQ